MSSKRDFSKAGTVKFYNSSEKIGCIIPDDGGAEVHFTRKNIVNKAVFLSKKFDSSSVRVEFLERRDSSPTKRFAFTVRLSEPESQSPKRTSKVTSNVSSKNTTYAFGTVEMHATLMNAHGTCEYSNGTDRESISRSQKPTSKGSSEGIWDYKAGTVKLYDSSKKIGYIIPDDGGANVRFTGSRVKKDGAFLSKFRGSSSVRVEFVEHRDSSSHEPPCISSPFKYLA